MKIVILVFLCGLTVSSFAKEPSHGDLRKNTDGVSQIWEEKTQKWIDIESFWIEYAKKNTGRYWGKSEEYPEYSKVNEHDTLLITSQKGICLMEFFHKRWRRANDVRRWNDELNNYSACPNVFD